MIHRHRDTIYQGGGLIHHHQMRVLVGVHLCDAFSLRANRHIHSIVGVLILFKYHRVRRNLGRVLIQWVRQSSAVETIQLFPPHWRRRRTRRWTRFDSIVSTLSDLKGVLVDWVLQLGYLKSEAITFCLDVVNFSGKILIFLLKLLEMLLERGDYKLRFSNGHIGCLLLLLSLLWCCF